MRQSDTRGWSGGHNRAAPSLASCGRQPHGTRGTGTCPPCLVRWLWGWTGTNKPGPGEQNTLVQLQSLSQPSALGSARPPSRGGNCSAARVLPTGAGEYGLEGRPGLDQLHLIFSTPKWGLRCPRLQPPLTLPTGFWGSCHNSKTGTIWKIKVFYLATLPTSVAAGSLQHELCHRGPSCPSAHTGHCCSSWWGAWPEPHLRHRVNNIDWALPKKSQHDPIPAAAASSLCPGRTAVLRCQPNTDLGAQCQGWALPKPAAGPPSCPWRLMRKGGQGKPFS